MRTIRSRGEHEIEIKRSRFLCAVSRVADEDEARQFIAERRKLHWNATHNCTAYILGPRADTQRSSDDGEPAGTAGVPMLEVLRHRELTDTVTVVTRYFGGVKLGAGGLIRAYGKAVGRTIDAVGVLEFRSATIMTVSTDYHQAGRLESSLRDSGHQVDDTSYAADVTFRVVVATGEEERFSVWVAELTGGTATIEPTGHRMVEFEPTDPHCQDG